MRIVIKVGSNVLTRDNGKLDVTRVTAIVDQVAWLKGQGHDVVLVSSGAVACGRRELKVDHDLDSVEQRQLFSALGQVKLIGLYYDLFREHNLHVGQVLTMKENFEQGEQYDNQKACMTVMLENGVVPIVNENDTVIGIAASGTTPYVIGALHEARKHGILTGCITSNPDSPMAAESDVAIETVVGPEFVTGSSRMKSGTAQKMALNMISTTLMIQLGRVKGNRMVNMQLTNKKLIDRGTRMIIDELGLDYEQANHLLLAHGSVKKAVDAYRAVNGK